MQSFWNVCSFFNSLISFAGVYVRLALCGLVILRASYSQQLTVEFLKQNTAYNEAFLFAASLHAYHKASVALLEELPKCQTVKSEDKAVSIDECNDVCRVVSAQRMDSPDLLYYAYLQLNKCSFFDHLIPNFEKIREAIVVSEPSIPYKQKAQNAYLIEKRNDLAHSEIAECTAYKFRSDILNFDCEVICISLYNMGLLKNITSIAPYCDVFNRSFKKNSNISIQFSLQALKDVKTPSPLFVEGYGQFLWQLFKFRVETLLLLRLPKEDGSLSSSFAILNKKFRSQSVDSCRQAKSLNDKLITDDRCVQYCNALTWLYSLQEASFVVEPQLCKFSDDSFLNVTTEFDEKQTFYVFLFEAAVREKVGEKLEKLRVSIDDGSVSTSPKCKASTPANGVQLPSSSCAAVCHMLQDVCDDHCLNHLQVWDIFSCNFGRPETLFKSTGRSGEPSAKEEPSAKRGTERKRGTETVRKQQLECTGSKK